MNTILTSKKIVIKFLISLILFAGFFNWYFIANAQGSLTLSISPSLFDMSVKPGQDWRSTLRIINVNDFDLTVYIDVVNFVPQGEGGDGKFLPVVNGEGGTLAEWFEISREAVVVPREQSKEIPFSVKVPFDASPGGHFAAILVGTKPPTQDDGQTRVQTSQMVTSLFFARVAGDINELGTIREFTTTKKYLNSPEATFELRFENKGNVHLQPQGDIVIYNMWGEERGVIPINQSSQFGNVLPDSIRKFTFGWKGEWSITDIGRYTAEATIAYGSESRQFSSSKTIFWVIPYKLLLGLLLGLVLFASLVTFLVKVYVRRMLVMAGIDVNSSKSVRLKALSATKSSVTLKSPLQAGLLDLKQRLRMTVSLADRLKTIAQFIVHYKIFFAAVLLAILTISAVFWFISNAKTDYRGYEVTYVNPDANVKLTSEEIIYNRLMLEKHIEKPVVNVTLPKLKIVNRSGVPGNGAEVKIRLESLGYEVTTLEADFTSPISRTVVVTSSDLQEAALRLSNRLNQALISPTTDENFGDTITVYVGDDIEPN